MPRVRRLGSGRMFKDGPYRLLASMKEAEDRDSHLRRLRSVLRPGQKLRYIKGQDGYYHIYINVIEEPVDG